jgi:hypothetical protein
MDYEETIAWWSKNKKWSGDLTCGAGWIEPLYDSESMVMDSNGDPVFVQP